MDGLPRMAKKPPTRPCLGHLSRLEEGRAAGVVAERAEVVSSAAGDADADVAEGIPGGSSEQGTET